MRWQALMMVLIAGQLIAVAGPQDDAAKKELKTFQGTWVLVSAVRDGKKPSDEKGIKLIITGTKYSLTQESSAVIGHRGTFLLDPAMKPKATDVTVTDGPDKGKIFLGIYELSSDDYKVCFASVGKDRPTEFSSKQGSGNLLQIWKREKK
jgi:uncharacterized protein (TIGR03067 family)